MQTMKVRVNGRTVRVVRYKGDARPAYGIDVDGNTVVGSTVVVLTALMGEAANR